MELNWLEGEEVKAPGVPLLCHLNYSELHPTVESKAAPITFSRKPLPSARQFRYVCSLLFLPLHKDKQVSILNSNPWLPHAFWRVDVLEMSLQSNVLKGLEGVHFANDTGQSQVLLWPEHRVLLPRLTLLDF